MEKQDSKFVDAVRDAKTYLYSSSFNMVVLANMTFEVITRLTVLFLIGDVT